MCGCHRKRLDGAAVVKTRSGSCPLQAAEELSPVLGLVHLVHKPIFDHQDTVRFLGQAIVVRHHDERDPILTVHLAHDGEDLIARPAIEIPRRLVGRTTLGWFASARMIAHRWFWPPLIVSGCLWSWPPNPTLSSSA